ncbi:MAG TPA: hypothetical protein VFA89_22795 [Terriglobales bacterium]|nr:hypothetical protein [Terriglobales bacterium]
MASEAVLIPINEPTLPSRPVLTSYDTGFEHSVEHLLELRRLVEDAADEPGDLPAWMQALGVAS